MKKSLVLFVVMIVTATQQSYAFIGEGVSKLPQYENNNFHTVSCLVMVFFTVLLLFGFTFLKGKKFHYLTEDIMKGIWEK